MKLAGANARKARTLCVILLRKPCINARAAHAGTIK